MTDRDFYCTECFFTNPYHETGCSQWPDEPVTLTIPRNVLEHIGWLVEINHGAWSDRYNALRPYLLDPSPDPSIPLPYTEYPEGGKQDD